MAWSAKPSKHPHTKMRWLPEDEPVKNRAVCDGCGQAWYLTSKPDGKGGFFTKWNVVAEGSDPGGQW